MRQWRNVQLNRPITMCIAQFNLYLVVLVVARPILPITRPAIASHNLARFNPGINPGIPGLSKLNPEIPGLAKRSGIAFQLNDWFRFETSTSTSTTTTIPETSCTLAVESGRSPWSHQHQAGETDRGQLTVWSQVMLWARPQKLGSSVLSKPWLRAVCEQTHDRASGVDLS